jgi:hypothetical protein
MINICGLRYAVRAKQNRVAMNRNKEQERPGLASLRNHSKTRKWRVTRGVEQTRFDWSEVMSPISLKSRTLEPELTFVSDRLT